MKKSLTLLICLMLLIAAHVDAKPKHHRSSHRGHSRGRGGDAIGEGTSIISVGYGFPNNIKTVLDIYKVYPGFDSKGFGPMFAKYDYFITDIISVGLHCGYSKADFSFDFSRIDPNGDIILDPIKLGYTSLGFNVAVNFNWLRKEKLVMYSGLGAGYNNATYKDNSNNPYFLITKAKGIPVGAELTAIGAIFAFSPVVGAYAEIGYGKAILQAGLNFRFGGN